MGYQKGDLQWASTVDVTPVASAARVANGDSGALELGDRTQLRLALAVTAHNRGDVDETLDVKIQTAPAAAGPWTDVAAWTQVAAQAMPHTERKIFSGIDRFYRVVWTVGGTTPSSTFAVAGEAV